MRLKTAIFVALLLQSQVLAQCIDLASITRPVEGLVLLCNDDYQLTEPIELISGAVLDCQGSVINGSPDVTGFHLQGKGIEFRRCVLQGFRAALSLSSAESCLITESSFLDNEYALIFKDSADNTVNSSVFKDNAAAILFDDSKSNLIYGNTFYPTGLVDVLDTENIYCWQGMGNEYIDESGPVCESPALMQEEEVPLDQPNVTQVIKEEISPDRKIDLPSPDSNGVRSFMSEVLIIDGYAPSAIGKELEQVMRAYERTSKIVDLQKSAEISPAKGTTRISLKIKVLQDVEDLYVYERIPKCVAAHISEVYFSREPDRVIEPDPIVVWHFPNANSGDELELSYEVHKEIWTMPETIIITEEVNVPDDGVCESPLSVPISRALRNDITRFLPVIFIVFIVTVFLYFNRFRKHFSRK